MSIDAEAYAGIGYKLNTILLEGFLEENNIDCIDDFLYEIFSSEKDFGFTPPCAYGDEILVGIIMGHFMPPKDYCNPSFEKDLKSRLKEMGLWEYVDQDKFGLHTILLWH